MAINPSTNGTMSGRITAADANYPYGSSKDETSPGAGDGTPYFKARADDIFGFQQSLLDEASIVPSGNADNKGTSQYKEAIRTITNMRTTTHDMASDANYTLTDAQNRKRRIIITDTGVLLTTGRDIIIGVLERNFIFVNSTLQVLTVKNATGTGIAVLPGAEVPLYNDGTNVVGALGDWAGVTYTDPDAVGANPTAKIYPDGTIVGSTDNGEYIKHPDGRKEATGVITPASNNNAGTVWTYPLVFNNILNADAKADFIISGTLVSSAVTEMGTITTSALTAKVLSHSAATIADVTNKPIYCKVEGN